MKTLHRANNGVGLFGDERDNIKDIRFWGEGAAILFWFELNDGREYLQYLTAREAMVFAQALDRLAIDTLREEAKQNLE